MRNICKITGCDGLAHGGGYCGKHYQQLNRRGIRVVGKTQRVQSSLVHDYFKNHEGFNQCYLAGILYGDGCIMGNRIRLSLTDFDIVSNMVSELNLKSKVTFDTRGTKPQMRVEFSSKKMVDDLKYFGVVEHKIHVDDFKVPDDINFRAFLIGAYESDGTVALNRTRGFCVLGGQTYCQSLSDKLVELGFECSVTRRYSGGVDIYSVNVSGRCHVDFIKWLYNPYDTPLFGMRKTCRALISLWASKGKPLDEQWVNCWKAKIRENYANQQPSLIDEEGSTTISRESSADENRQCEVPTTLILGKDMVWFPTKVGLLQNVAG